MTGDVNILVAFYSRNGATERLAMAITEGAVQAGANIRLRRVRDFVADGIVGKVPGWKRIEIACTRAMLPLPKLTLNGQIV